MNEFSLILWFKREIMNNFRLAILDYALTHLTSETTQNVLNDLIVMKQKNFERTDPTYVVLDKHDMIGTHFLIYDTADIYQPKIIFALRVTYEDRSIHHKLKTPLQELVPKLSLPLQAAYEKFHADHPILVDCNSWCVDVNFSQKKSNLKLSAVGYTMVYLHLIRMGHSHMIGCTNERYKASRWLEDVGPFQKGFEFIHPAVPDPHLMILIESLNHEHFRSVYFEYKELFDQLYDVVPTNVSYASIEETILKQFGAVNLRKQA